MFTSPLVLKAFEFSARKHSGQTRRGSGAAYVSHPLAVSYLVAAYKRSKHLDELLCAALLHDVLEDTDTTFTELAQEFTPLVASLVQELTNDAAEVARVGKQAYQLKKMSGMSSYGLVLKLADRLHNISDHPSEKMVQDTLALLRELKVQRKLSPSQLELVQAIEQACERVLQNTEPCQALLNAL